MSILTGVLEAAVGAVRGTSKRWRTKQSPTADPDNLFQTGTTAKKMHLFLEPGEAIYDRIRANVHATQGKSTILAKHGSGQVTNLLNAVGELQSNRPVALWSWKICKHPSSSHPFGCAQYIQHALPCCDRSSARPRMQRNGLHITRNLGIHISQLFLEHACKSCSIKVICFEAF